MFENCSTISPKISYPQFFTQLIIPKIFQVLKPFKTVQVFIIISLDQVQPNKTNKLELKFACRKARNYQKTSILCTYSQVEFEVFFPDEIEPKYHQIRWFSQKILNSRNAFGY